MKKALSLFILALLLTGASVAQKQLYFGLAGTGLSSVITNQNNYGQPFEMDYAMKFGGAGNLSIGFDFSKSLGLRLDLGYGALGQKYKDNYNDTAYTRNIKLGYLQIPLLFKFRTSGEVARFYFAVGPQLNYLLSAKQEYLKAGIIDSTGFTTITGKPVLIGQEDIKDRYSSIDVMGRLDLGAEISIAENLFLNLGMTMAYGFMDINAEDFRIPDNTGNYNPSHNIYGGITFGISYTLPVGSK